MCLSVYVCVCLIRAFGLFASESTQAIPITGLKLALQGILTPDPVQGGQACKSNKGSKPSVEPPVSLTLRKTMKFLSRHFSKHTSISSLSTW